MRKLMPVLMLVWVVPLLSNCAASPAQDAPAAGAEPVATTAPAAQDATAPEPVTDPAAVAAAKQSIHPVEIDARIADHPAPLTLDVDDSVRLLVLGQPELSQIATVEANGAISLPFIGEVPAEGRPIDEVRRDVVVRFEKLAFTPQETLQVGDTVHLSVWHQLELTGDSTVRPDGMISLPLIGDVPALNQTIPGLAKVFQDGLAYYLRDPHVSLNLTNPTRNLILNPKVALMSEHMHSRNVAVLGEVLIPGLVPYRPSLTVLDALAQAHHKDSAKLNGVILIRSYKSDTPEYLVLHLSDFIAGKAKDQNVRLRPNDIIIVPKTLIAKVDDFISEFFAQTRPVFDWWIALQGARYAEAVGKATQRLNNTLTNQQN